MNGKTNSARLTARIVGILVLAAFLIYGVGSTIATTLVATPGEDANGSGNALLTTGVLLMILNSVVVIGIGLVMFPILRPHNSRIASGYVVTRIWEGTFLAVGAMSLLVTRTAGANFLAYNLGMAGLGLGSLFFCFLLYRSTLVPGFLAVWGFVGYACFAAGSILEIAGVAGAGLVSTIPGGLFELFFGIWLIARGFTPSALVAATMNEASVNAAPVNEEAPVR